jgi:phosphopantetheinyl transferase
MDWQEIITGKNISNMANTGHSVDIFAFTPSQLTESPDQLRKLLSTGELERASRFQFDADREMYILSHGFTRQLLARKTGLAPENIRFDLSKNGKPSVNSKNIHFNLSHTREVFALALSPDMSLGIDVECLGREIDWQPVSRLYYSDNERQWIASHPAEEQKKAFFIIWTRKEALLKAIGCGIINDLAMVDVIEPVNIPNPLYFADTEIPFPLWQIKSFCNASFVISVAANKAFAVKFN